MCLDNSFEGEAAMAMMVTAVQQTGLRLPLVLSGGCFQNRILLERTVEQLQRIGREPHWHRRIPTNDSGLAAGQALLTNGFP